MNFLITCNGKTIIASKKLLLGLFPSTRKLADSTEKMFFVFIEDVYNKKHCATIKRVVL